MASTFLRQKQAQASRPETDDPFAEQLQLSRVHTRLVPMRRSGTGYAIEPATAAWFELPASRGFAGYGLGRALGLLLDALQGLNALHATTTAGGERFAHGEFAPLQFRVDPLGVCRLVPLTTRHYISEDVTPPQAVLGFLSPERLIAEKVGVRADVFSAGVLLWEALAGRRLTEGPSAEAIVERLLSQKLRVPDLPPQLAWATPLKAEVERALSVNQQRRFADCEEFAAVITRVAHDHVASHDEIAAFFAASLRAPPPPPASSSVSPPPSSAPPSQERLIARRGATLRMLPVRASAYVPANAAADGPRPAPTLKMNVTLRMAQVPLPLPPLPPLLARVSTPPPLPPLLARVSTPPPLPRVSTPPPLPRVSTPPPLPRVSTPPPLPPPELPAQELSGTVSAGTSPPLEVGVPEAPPAMAHTPEPTQAASLPKAVRTGAPSWTTPRRWLFAALLIGAIVGIGMIATRGARSTTAAARPRSPRTASVPTAASVASRSTPALEASALGLGDPEEGDVSAAPGAAVIPNAEHSAGPPTPPVRGRPAASVAVQRARDYGI